MQIQAFNSNNSNNNTNFKARIVKNPTVNAYVKYMDECSTKEGYAYYGNKYKDLWKSICSAFEKHPSDAEINLSILSKSTELFGARGHLKTKYGNVLDTEPARSDSFAPLENVIKRILHPDNKEMLSKVLGEKDADVTIKWWNKNIKPLWSDIKESYTEPTVWSLQEIELTKNNEWNHEFRMQSILPRPFFNYTAIDYAEPVVEKTPKKKNFIQRLLGL